MPSYAVPTVEITWSDAATIYITDSFETRPSVAMLQSPHVHLRTDDPLPTPKVTAYDNSTEPDFSGYAPAVLDIVGQQTTPAGGHAVLGHADFSADADPDDAVTVRSWVLTDSADSVKIAEGSLGQDLVIDAADDAIHLDVRLPIDHSQDV